MARTDLREPRRAVVVPRGRVRRFVHRHGWRAYAIPLLTIATIVVLFDLALAAPATTAQAGGGPSAVAPPAVASAGGPAVTSAAQGDAEPTGQAAGGAEPETYVDQGDGTLSVVDGGSPVYGTGPLQRFIVEIEDGIDVDGEAF